VGLLIGDLVEEAAAAAPRVLAATMRDRTVTFAELDAETSRVAHTLAALGLGRGDVLSWWTDTTMDALAAMLACARLGAIFAPLPPAATPAEVKDVIGYVEPRLLVVDAPRREAAAELGVPLRTVGTGGPGDLLELARSAAAAPVRSAVTETDPHIMYLTSGSTGTPKGVLVSHRATWLRSIAGGGRFSGDRGVLCSFPLHHYGGWAFVVDAWLHRTTVHLVPRADAEHLHAALALRRPSAMYCIPAVWERVLAAPGDLSCLAHADTGTSRISSDLVERIRSRACNATTTVLYGSSEAGPMAGLYPWQFADRPGSVGRPIPPGVMALAEDNEILFRGPTVMNGYFGRPDATEEALDSDGWYHSGDVGECDDDGFFTIVGRKREIIRSGGEWVSPAEVEEALRRLPEIADVAVVGLPDEQWGEIVCAVVVPAPRAPAPDVAALRARLNGIARFKHPRRIVTVESIPRTSATGQIQRTRLRAEVLTGHP